MVMSAHGFCSFCWNGFRNLILKDTAALGPRPALISA